MNENWVDAISLRIRPSLKEKTGIERAGLLLDMSALIGSFPIAIIGIVWLVLVTDWALFQQEWIPLGIIFGLLILFNQLTFELRLQMTKTIYSSASGSLNPMIAWSAALIFGPVALWVDQFATTIDYINRFWRESSIDMRWNMARNYVQQLAFTVTGSLLGLSVYQWVGGNFPLPGLTWQPIWQAGLGTLIMLIYLLGYIIPFARRMIRDSTFLGEGGQTSSLDVILFLLIGVNLSSVALPFAIFAAGLYTLHGIGVYLFFMSAVLMASLLANRLSKSVQRNEQRSRELARLEALGRDIIDMPPDTAVLPQLLNEHLKGMLVSSILYVWLLPDEVLFIMQGVTEMPGVDEAHRLVLQDSAPFYQVSGIKLPDETIGRISREGLIVPIKDDEGVILGGIYVLQREDYGNVMDFQPAVNSLAAQIASAIHRIEQYEQAIENEKMTHELEVAGRIQASFLPNAVPQIDGWEIAATLEPARQTSGDFFDFVDLENGRLGVIVADVADKGTGAALYMALSRTLIRTYAMQHPEAPEKALELANERILEDTESDQFVTVFYGVLDIVQGTLTYTNAGHNPAVLVSADGKTAPQWLSQTGIPLGMFPEMQWRQNIVPIDPGDLLIMYSDGVTEAQDNGEQEYGEDRLLQVVEGENGRSVQTLESDILTSIHQFVGDAPQFDDITLMIVQRNHPNLLQ
ncbi:MAG: PP2C family protein-serine/threonine phosphatase [Chloroflexi bacterium]|nr:PP2C family protein-serine/threonine phosphatase [Chloroflexota bacterium]